MALNCRKKQFPPVFWQRLYNVSGSEDSVRYVGGVEVGEEGGVELKLTTRRPPNATVHHFILKNLVSLKIAIASVFD